MVHVVVVVVVCLFVCLFVFFLGGGGVKKICQTSLIFISLCLRLWYHE